MILVRCFSAASLTVLLLAGLTGCDNAAPPRPEGVTVSGKILLPNDAPLSGGTLILRPESGLYGAFAEIKPNGSFTLQDSGNDDVVAGKYQVFVRFADSRHDELSSQVNERYQQSGEDGDSDVIVNIQESTEKLVIRLNY